MFGLPAGLGTAGTSPQFVIAANNCNLPWSYNTGSNWVQNDRTTHIAGPDGIQDPEAWFVNGIMITNGEQNAYYDFTLSCGLDLNGVYYPFYDVASGQRTATLVKEWGMKRYRIRGLFIPPGTVFHINNLRIATDNGAAGSYNVITSTAGIPARNDGTIPGTNPAIDYTIGVGLPSGATVTPLNSGNIVAGVIQNNLTRATGGALYTGGPSLRMWYGPAEINQPGATYPGTTTATGFGNLSGGSVNTITVSGGGTGHDGSNPPKAFLGGGGGFGVNTQATYGPFLITGRKVGSARTTFLVGDSNFSGIGSNDGTGDLNGSTGATEQFIAPNYPILKFCHIGESAVGWLGGNTRQLALLSEMATAGVQLDRAIVGLGTNDFNVGSPPSQATVETRMNNIRTVLLNAGFGEVYNCTIPPSTTSTDGWTTTGANQSGVNSAFGAAGSVLSYNAAMLGGTGVITDGVFDIAGLIADSVIPWQWRVAGTFPLGAVTGTAFTPDGIHYSKGAGIPYVVNNLTVPW